MKKIIFYNRKGGVGKTTSTVNIGACLAKDFGKRVLIVDCDSQCNTTRYLTANEDVQIKKSLEDVFCGEKENVIHKVRFYERNSLKYSNIDLIGACRDMEWSEPEEEDLPCFLEFMESIENDYDFCLFDCPPHPSAYMRCVMYIAQYIIVPLEAKQDSLNGYSIVVDELKHMRKESKGKIKPVILGAVINNFSKIRFNDNFWAMQFAKIKGINCFDTKISHGAVIENASVDGRPIVFHQASHNIAKEYHDLCKEIMTRLNNVK